MRTNKLNRPTSMLDTIASPATRKRIAPTIPEVFKTVMCAALFWFGSLYATAHGVLWLGLVLCSLAFIYTGGLVGSLLGIVVVLAYDKWWD